VGWLWALGATAAFSLAPTVSKAAIDLGADAVGLLTLRLGATTVLLSATVGLAGAGRRPLRGRAFRMAVAAGAANGIGMVTFFASLTYLDASVASMIFSISPLFLLVLLALRGERFTYRNLIRLALGLGGVYLLIGPGGQVSAAGVLLAFGAVVTVPIQIMLIQWYLQDEDPWSVTLCMVVTMGVVAGAWWAVQGLPWREVPPAVWLLLAVLVVVSTYLARLGMFAAIRAIGGGQFGLLAPVETMLTVMWSVLFLGERLTPIQWLGSALILTSALLALRRLRRVRWKPA
jgi:drug/metabolite transporter (DMT)-like permease